MIKITTEEDLLDYYGEENVPWQIIQITVSLAKVLGNEHDQRLQISCLQLHVLLKM